MITCPKIHACHIMHVQTIPKSPPKIIVQVAKSCDFFFIIKIPHPNTTYQREGKPYKSALTRGKPYICFQKALAEVLVEY